MDQPRTGGYGIRFESVTVRFGDVDAVQSASFEVPHGTFRAIVGESGSGKTTLLRAAAGLQRCSAGQVTFSDPHGRAIVPRGGEISVCFQEPRLLPWRSALANVALPLELAGVPRRERLARARAMIAATRLDGAERRLPAQLSGGMRMRVGLARALVTSPKVLLLDEPCSALDDFTREEMDDEIWRLREQTGATAVLVTHGIAEAVRLADAVTVLSSRPGRVRSEVQVRLSDAQRRDRTCDGFAAATAALMHELARARQRSAGAAA